MTGSTVNHLIWGFGHSLAMGRHLTRGNEGSVKRRKRLKVMKASEEKEDKSIIKPAVAALEVSKARWFTPGSL